MIGLFLAIILGWSYITPRRADAVLLWTAGVLVAMAVEMIPG